MTHCALSAINCGQLFAACHRTQTQPEHWLASLRLANINYPTDTRVQTPWRVRGKDAERFLYLVGGNSTHVYIMQAKTGAKAAVDCTPRMLRWQIKTTSDAILPIHYNERCNNYAQLIRGFFLLILIKQRQFFSLIRSSLNKQWSLTIRFLFCIATMYVLWRVISNWLKAYLLILSPCSNINTNFVFVSILRKLIPYCRDHLKRALLLQSYELSHFNICAYRN